MSNALFSPKLIKFISDTGHSNRNLTDEETYKLFGEYELRLKDYIGMDPDPEWQFAKHFYVHWSIEIDLKQQTIKFVPSIEARESSPSYGINQKLKGATKRISEIGVSETSLNLPEKCLIDPLNTDRFTTRYILESERLEAIKKLKKAKK